MKIITCKDSYSRPGNVAYSSWVGLNITAINLGEDFYTICVMGTVKIECDYVSTGSCSFFELQSAVLKASQGKILYRFAFLETTY